MDARYTIYHEMIDELDESYRLMHEYDSMIHDYGTAVLYQAESKIIHLVGERPGITAVRNTQENSQRLFPDSAQAPPEGMD